MIKKRTIRGNFRKKDNSDDNSDSDKELTDSKDDSSSKGKNGDIDRSSLEEIKCLQQMRTKKSGSLVTTTTSSSSCTDKKQKVSKDIDTVMKSQFNSQMDYGIQSNGGVIHEKIMQEFIDSKLGLKKEENTSSAYVDKEAEKLYQIPDEMKGLVKKGEESDALGLAASWSVGLAEVQLPDSYRVVNKESIERAKEQARRVQEASLISSAIPITDDILSLKDKLAANSSAYQRFRSDLVSFDYDPLQPLQSNDYALEEYKQQLEKQEKVMKSTDDHALAMFKKKHFERNR